MTELTKAESSRINGTKSHGPVTREGKSRSCMNSLKHGLTAKTLSLADKSQDAFNLLAQSHRDLWQPVNEIEGDLVEEMTVAKWLQHRIRQAEALQHLDAESNTLALLRRYEGRLNHKFHRAINQLLKIRAAPDPPVLRNELTNLLVLSTTNEKRTTSGEQRRTNNDERFFNEI